MLHVHTLFLSFSGFMLWTSQTKSIENNVSSLDVLFSSLIWIAAANFWGKYAEKQNELHFLLLYKL